MYSHISSPNLLDNWYFADPIDQRGGYVVPPGMPYYADPSGATQAGTTSGYIPTVMTSNGWTIVVEGTNYYVVAGHVVRGYTNPAGYIIDGTDSTDIKYTIDRWYLDTVIDGAVLIDNEGIRLTNRDMYWGTRLNQRKELSGKKVTASAFVSDGRSDYRLISGTIESVVWE